MSVKYTDNTRQISSGVKRSNQTFIRGIMDEIIKLSTPKTPKSKGGGRLRRDTEKRMNGNQGVLTWKAPYAKYQERGYTSGKVKHYTTPGTGKKFAENAVKEAVKKSDVIARKAYKDWN